MADVFISYCNEPGRQARADRLAHFLEQTGISVWSDDQLELGKTWHPDLEQNIASAKIMITLWCRAAKRSPWVLRENEEAVRQGKLLIPARLQLVRVPNPIASIQGVDLIDWAGQPDEANLVRLINFVCQSLEQPFLITGRRLRELKNATPFSALPNEPAQIGDEENTDVTLLEQAYIKRLTGERDPAEYEKYLALFANASPYKGVAAQQFLDAIRSKHDIPLLQEYMRLFPGFNTLDVEDLFWQKTVQLNWMDTYKLFRTTFPSADNDGRLLIAIVEQLDRNTDSTNHAGSVLEKCEQILAMFGDEIDRRNLLSAKAWEAVSTSRWPKNFVRFSELFPEHARDRDLPLACWEAVMARFDSEVGLQYSWAFPASAYAKRMEQVLSLPVRLRFVGTFAMPGKTELIWKKDSTRCLITSPVMTVLFDVRNGQSSTISESVTTPTFMDDWDEPIRDDCVRSAFPNAEIIDRSIDGKWMFIRTQDEDLLVVSRDSISALEIPKNAKGGSFSDDARAFVWWGADQEYAGSFDFNIVDLLDLGTSSARHVFIRPPDGTSLIRRRLEYNPASANTAITSFYSRGQSGTSDVEETLLLSRWGRTLAQHIAGSAVFWNFGLAFTENGKFMPFNVQSSGWGLEILPVEGTVADRHGFMKHIDHVSIAPDGHTFIFRSGDQLECWDLCNSPSDFSYFDPSTT